MVDINLFFPLLVYFSFFVLSTSFLCSSSRVFSSLPVSPMYSAPQFLHGIWYTSSPCSSSSTLSLGCTKKRLRVVWGRIVVATPYFFSTRCTLSEINLSKYKLSGNQNKILAKGLNYAVTPEKIPTEEFVVAAEQATWSLPQEQKDKLRADVTGVLKSAKVPKQNITREERTALKGLQKEKSITILPADKGKATVIMETREYQEK